MNSTFFVSLKIERPQPREEKRDMEKIGGMEQTRRIARKRLWGEGGGGG